MTTIQLANGEAKQVNAGEVTQKADASRWYPTEIPIPAITRSLLELYSKIPSGDVESHVYTLRERAFKSWPYPCIGLGRFLDLTTAKHPEYSLVLHKLQQGGTFLDAGCCLGQDIRKLLQDGAPSSLALYGTDVEGAFLDLGYDLFRDRDTLKSKFVAADLTKPLASEIQVWKGGMDVISAQSLFHLFRLPEQQMVARNLVDLSRCQAGTIICGRQLGHENSGEQAGISEDMRIFMHNAESWTAFWEEIGYDTESRWDVQTWTEPPTERTKQQPYYSPGLGFLTWTARRLS